MEIPVKTMNFQFSNKNSILKAENSKFRTWEFFRNWKLEIRNSAVLTLAIFSIFFSVNHASASMITRAPNNFGMVGYWSFEDGKGSTVTDFSGRGNTGTLTNMASPNANWVAGKRGNAISLDGTNDQVRISPGGSLTGAYTVSAWVKPATTSGTMTIFGTRNGGGTGFDMSLTNGTGLHGDIGDGTTWLTTSADASSAYSAGLWYHVVYSVTTTGYTIYVNGAQVGTNTYSAATPLLFDATRTITIGDFYDGGGQPFNGSIDEVRIYNRALSATEVSALYGQTTQAVIKNSSRGLVGHWTFEEGTGTATADKTGNGNTGTLTNGPSWASGRFGKGLSFDGSDDYVQISDSSALSPTTAITISQWLYPTSAGSAGGDLGPLWKGNVASGVDQSYGFLWLATRIIAFRFGSSSGIEGIDALTALPLDAWSHVVGTWDGVNKKIYINGVFSDGSATSITALKDTSQDLYIGGTFAVSNHRYFSGKIDDTRIYNRALSAQEVSNLYNSSGEALGILNRAHRDTLTSGLVGYWSFDGPTMTTATSSDSSGQGNHGTLTGGPTKTIGVLGQALKFDGSDDYVTMGDAVALNGVQSRTLSTWVKFSSDPLTTAQWFIERSNATSATYWLWWNGDNSFSLGDNTLVCGHRIANGTGEQIANTWTPSANNWYHVSCVYNGSQLIEYVNGVLLGSAGSATGSVTDETSSARTLQLGRRIATGGSNLNGLLDDVRIYNRALSANEVLTLFNSTGGRGLDVPYVAPPDTTAPVISSLVASVGTPCGQTQAISWTTNEASDTQVEYGTTVSYGSSSSLNASMVTSHSTSATGLSYNTLYYYRARSADVAGNIGYSTGTFTTPSLIICSL